MWDGDQVASDLQTRFHALKEDARKMVDTQRVDLQRLQPIDAGRTQFASMAPA
jgi:hypothetical protein